MRRDIPLNHVPRSAPPWRQEAETLTECGLPVSSYPTISRDELAQQARDLGRQRVSLLTCMTCLNTAERWWHASWEHNPRAALARELERHWRDDATRELVDHEVRAMLTLIELHADEFAEIVRGLTATDDLEAERAARREREARQTRRLGR